MLFPDEVSLLKEEKRIRKAALMCNFVDRETERPALGPNDFRPPIVTSTKTLTYSRKQKGKLRYNVQIPRKLCLPSKFLQFSPTCFMLKQTQHISTSFLRILCFLY